MSAWALEDTDFEPIRVFQRHGLSNIDNRTTNKNSNNNLPNKFSIKKKFYYIKSPKSTDMLNVFRTV